MNTSAREYPLTTHAPPRKKKPEMATYQKEACLKRFFWLLWNAHHPHPLSSHYRKPQSWKKSTNENKSENRYNQFLWMHTTPL